MGPMSTEKCASCVRYPLPDAVETGRALCPLMQDRRAWDSGVCIHYSRANDIKERGAIVRQLVKQGKP